MPTINITTNGFYQDFYNPQGVINMDTIETIDLNTIDYPGTYVYGQAGGETIPLNYWATYGPNAFPKEDDDKEYDTSDMDDYIKSLKVITKRD